MFFNEYYVYETPENIKKCQLCFDKLEKICKGKKDVTTFNDKELKVIKYCGDTIIKSLIKEFNFSPESSIRIIFSNSFIFQVSTLYSNEFIDFYLGNFDLFENQGTQNIRDFIGVRNNRFIYKDKKTCCPNIEISTYALSILTARQVMGCLMHEVGHTFQVPFRVQTYRMAMYKKVKKIAEKLHIEYNGTEDSKLIRALQKIRMYIGGDSSITSEYGEIFADQFAAVYGYAEEVQEGLSALEKLNYDYYNKSPMSLLLYIQVGLFMLITGDPHPSLRRRIEYMMIAIKKELQNPKLNAKYRKILEEKLKVMDAKYKELVKKDANDSIATKLIKFFGRIRYNSPDEISDKKLDDKNSNLTLYMDLLTSVKS